MAARFDISRNFLATDKVPDSIFGYPIVSRKEDYTPEDVEFFRAHPEAGGYYDLGDGGDGEQGAEGGGDSIMERIRRRAGEAAEVLDYAGSRIERGLAGVADRSRAGGLPLAGGVVGGVAKALKPAVVGARAALANVAAGGGRYYQPEMRDERNFSRDELASLAANVAGHGGRSASRYGYTGDIATRWANSQSVGGASVRDGAVTDTFDVDSRDPYGLSSGLHETADTYAGRGEIAKAVAFGTLGNLVDMGHKALGAVFGDESSPDAGKVRTEIPVEALPEGSGYAPPETENAQRGPAGDDEEDQAAEKGGDTADADRPEMAFMGRNPTLFSHVKRYEKLELSPYEDIGGHAIGYGAHRDANGAAVTAETPALQDEAAAAALLARDLYARREALRASLPNWNYIPGNAKQALLDVSMGKDGILSAKESKGLHRDLRAAGRNPEKLLAAVKKHYYSYLTKDPKYRSGLMDRRIAGGRTFFGEEFSYKGKKWDPEQGFVKEGGE